MDDLMPVGTTGPEPAEAPAFNEIRHGFSLDGQHYLLAAGVFAELTARVTLCPLPDSPPWFAGFINHRGHTVPVHDLHYLIHRERADLREPYWILLLDQQPHTAGFLLTALPGVVTDPEPVAPEARSDAADNALKPFLAEQYRAQGKTWHALDHRELLKQLKKHFYQPAALFETDS